MKTVRVVVAVILLVNVGAVGLSADGQSEPPQRECFDFAPAPLEPIIPVSQVTEGPRIESPTPYPGRPGYTPAHYPREMSFEVTLDSAGTVTRVCGPQNVSDTKWFCVGLGKAKYVPARVGETPVATVFIVRIINPIH